MNLPNRGCPLFVFGTVMDYSDILYSLRRRENFTSIWMPALNPDPEHEVLWEELFNKERLEERKLNTGWKSFATEFLLMPMMSTEAALPRELLDKVIEKDLRNFQVPGY
jgi:hypothetical protein